MLNFNIFFSFYIYNRIYKIYINISYKSNKNNIKLFFRFYFIYIPIIIINSIFYKANKIIINKKIRNNKG